MVVEIQQFRGRGARTWHFLCDDYTQDYLLQTVLTMMQGRHPMSITARLSLIPMLIALGCLLFWAAAVFSPTQKTPQDSAIAKVTALYDFTKGVSQSQKMGSRLEEIVHNRVSCYSSTPLQRNTICNVNYVEQIVAIGRRKILSAPDMGSFVDNVRFCPIAYSACMGERGNAGECVVMEARCIDGMYDAFWRGRPFDLKLVR